MLKANEIRILIVDDEPLTLKAVAANFEVFGFQVEKCSSVEDAEKFLKEKSFHIVLVDWHMPKGGGGKLLRTIRSKNWESPTVFLMTGDLKLDAEMVYNEGADGFLLKPFDAAATRDLIQQSCLSRQQNWMTPFRKDPSSDFNGKCESFDGKKEVCFGRGGFYAHVESPSFAEEEVIQFSIDLTGFSKKLVGTGVVRWVRGDDRGVLSGIGVEVKFLEDEGRGLYLDWLEKNKPIAFIPDGE